MILLIDNYDSFTYNLKDYLLQVNNEPVVVIRNDEADIEEIRRMSPKALVISPGPKTPSEAGISEKVVREFYSTIPVLGICLGHQVIGKVFGGSVKKAQKPMHGKISEVEHTGSEIFKDIPSTFQVTRYHSLVVDTEGLPGQLEILAKASGSGEIMAIRHKEHPVYGIQFHPESVMTTEGLRIIRNFADMIR